MKSAFTIALVIGAASATSLRSERNTAEIDVHDTSFIEALASKYDCREAGATLEETITKVKTKNAAEMAALGTECTKRRKDYNSPWEAAKQSFDTKTPKVVPEEMATYNSKTERANKNLADVKTAQAAAVAAAEEKASKAQADFTAKDTVFTTARGAFEGALKTFAREKKTFVDVTKPRGLALNARTYAAAKKLADDAYAATMKAANSGKETATRMCEGITAARKKHVDADAKLLNSEIAPLIKELSELKCVDSYDKQRTASGLDDSFIELTADEQAACAMTADRAQSFLETTHYLGALPLDAQFKVFTDRVDEERTHMNNVHTKCMDNLRNIFSKEESAANKLLSETSQKNSDIKTKADQALDRTLEKLIATNRKIVAEKKEDMDAPRAAKEAAGKALISAKTGLDAAQNTRRSEESVAIRQHKNAMNEAMSTKNSNIKSRHATLRTIRETARTKYKEDKKFVEEYCASSQRDLSKERNILNKIEKKLGGLKVTQTAVTGATNTDVDIVTQRT